VKGKVIYESDEFKAISDLKAAAVTRAFLNDIANVVFYGLNIYSYISRGSTGYRIFASNIYLKY